MVELKFHYKTKENKRSKRLSQFNEYIIKNINKLEEWSGFKYKEVLYDSNEYDKSNEIIINKTINHSYLYFIIIDSDNNIFNH